MVESVFLIACFFFFPFLWWRPKKWVTSLIFVTCVFPFWAWTLLNVKSPNKLFCFLRSKLVKVENFEAYFKKQQADSNCGFAEEYEVRCCNYCVFNCFMFLLRVGKYPVLVHGEALGWETSRLEGREQLLHVPWLPLLPCWLWVLKCPFASSELYI